MAIDPEARIRYLSLALLAQKLIDALIDLVERDQEQGLDANLNEALESLIALTRPRPRRHPTTQSPGLRQL